MVALVALRLGLGCHFLYEGVWKITHHKQLSAWGGPAIREPGGWSVEHLEEFTAEPFLTQAKGPLSGFFYAMVPDINARERLSVIKDQKGKPTAVDGKPIADRWDRICCEFVDYYRPSPSNGDATEAYKRLKRAAERTYKEFRAQLDEYLKDNLDAIAAHFDSLDRFENDPEWNQKAPFQKQRRWDRMMDLRREADKWIKDIEGQEQAYVNSLWNLLDEQQKKQGQPTGTWNILRWERMEQINFAVTFGLTAIGLCLVLGFFTPLAALGGAAFMCFVVMTQPGFPGIYPPDSPIVGHALLVNKDFVEMLALLVVSATGAGRWAGLDFFFCRWIAALRNRRKRLAAAGTAA
ncbi:MAG: DoxX family protein [Planctomycetaceae bacterium]|nr:DoxX family protein [Planctomycetaceae bacterium]